MRTTYSFSEIKSFIRILDISDLKILRQLIFDEAKWYATYEFTAINRMIMIREKQIARNEVKLEFLLAYN